MYRVQGVYRGLGDTRTPLWGTLACNAINVVLAPLLIFSADWGCRGAALATVTSQVFASSLAPHEPKSAPSSIGCWVAMTLLWTYMRRWSP